MSTALELATTLLNTQSDALREVYSEKVLPMHKRFGGVMAKLVEPSKRRVDGDGVTIQVRDHGSYGSRWSRSINGGFPKPDTFGHKKYKVRLSETDANNDLGRQATSVSITDLDLQRVSSKGASAIEDFVAANFDDCVKDLSESDAIHQYVPVSGLIGLVNGTPKKNDRKHFHECAAITTSGGAKFKVDTGSLGFMSRHRKMSIYNGSGAAAVRRFDVEVSDKDPRSLAVGVFGLDANDNPSSTIDLSALSDNDGLYIQGEKDKAPITIAAWMARPSDATTDSFFQKNREDADYRWMQPHFTGPSTLTPLSLGMVDAAADEKGYIDEDDERGYLCFGRTEMITTWKRLVGADTIIQYPTDAQKGELLAQFGFDGAIARHEKFGRLMFKGDALMPDNTLWMLLPGSWETIHALSGAKFRWMPGLVGYYYRANSPANDGSWSTVWRADGYTLKATICDMPNDQIVFENVQPTSTVSLPA